VLTGPKCPLTRPTSSSSTLCQKRVSNLPCRIDVVVTFIASCPPPRSTYGIRGASAALFNGVSVVNVLSTRSVFVSCICDASAGPQCADARGRDVPAQTCPCCS
jgi:hypothetical protein